jgi:hypothetical protein
MPIWQRMDFSEGQLLLCISALRIPVEISSAFLRDRPKSEISDFPSLVEKPRFRALRPFYLLTTNRLTFYQ